jgi:uncharacterized protein (DUF433 family)
MATHTPGLFNGVYSYGEAARLLNVTSQRVSRWADGYVFQLKYGQGKSRPVLQSDRHKGVISFEELIELFFVREYLALRVQLPHIRATAESLAERLGPFPFSRAELYVRGRELLVKTADGIFNRPDVGQLVADFAASLIRQVDMRDKLVARYLPDGFDRRVYLDKEIHAGEASVTSHAIPTRIIYSLWQQEGDLGAVADYHDITVEDVSVAVRYEGQWRLAA